MRFSTGIYTAALVAVAAAAPKSSSTPAANPTATDPAAVYAAQATAKTESPTSHVKGKVFDRFVTIWFENTDFQSAAAEANFEFFAKKGITLENYFAVTHPSEPNYMAAVGGDYFGLNGDPFIAVPENVSTVVDLLEDKKISWGIYQEDMPYSGFQGFSSVNQKTGKNDYVRKHNPAVLFNSVANDADRLSKIKNLTMFQQDLKANKLPQWMFITPNMTSDAHDAPIGTAGAWLRTFLEPLLNDKNFMQNTMVLITFDENSSYPKQNRAFSVLLGDAIPKNLVGTTDSNFYNHYSEIATVEANWDTHTLGRYDVGANVFSNVAKHTNDKLRSWTGTPALADTTFNASYPGIFHSTTWAPQPVPNTLIKVNGRTVLPKIRKQWVSQQKKTVYCGQLEIPTSANPPKGTCPGPSGNDGHSQQHHG
ncbi:hypothetical protein V499_07458 [Pseudogymnoascus sp. VKM F-103]|nr:hypothetical protein V499_07458 [Pseudogymnoascus sp. VKM F-103]